MKHVKPRLGIKSLLRAALLAGLPVVFALALPAPTPAQGSAASVLGLFPKQMKDFGYADLKTARSFPWFEQVQQALMPGNLLSFEKFVTSNALSAGSELDEIYWGQTATSSAGDQLLGVALGQFDVDATQDHLKKMQVPAVEYQGSTLYAFGSGLNPTDLLFFFIDSNTAAFGQRAALQALIDARTGAADSFFLNDSLYPLVSSPPANALLWAVLDSSSAQTALQDFLPEASQFPQLTAVRDRMKALIIRLDTPFSSNDDGQLNVSFQAVCGSPDDANLIAAAMQVALMYRRSQASSADTGVAAVLDQARVTPHGDTLELQFSITQQQILALVLAGMPPH